MTQPTQLSCLARSQSICGQDNPEKSLALNTSSPRPWAFAQAVELLNQFATVDRLLRAPQGGLPLNFSASHQQQLKALLTAYQQAFEVIQLPLKKFMGYVLQSGVSLGSVSPIPLTLEDLSAFEQAVAGLTQVVGQLQAFSETLTQTPRLDTFNFALFTLFNGIAVVSAALSLVSFLLQLAVPPLLPLLVSLMTACASFAIHVGNKLYEIQCQNQLKDWHQNRTRLSEFVHQLQRFKDSVMWQQISQVAVAQQSAARRVEGLEEVIQAMQKQLEEQNRLIQQLQHAQATAPINPSPSVTGIALAPTGSAEHFAHAVRQRVQGLSKQGVAEATIRQQVAQETHEATDKALGDDRADRHQRQQQTRDQAIHFDKKP